MHSGLLVSPDRDLSDIEHRYRHVVADPDSDSVRDSVRPGHELRLFVLRGGGYREQQSYGAVPRGLVPVPAHVADSYRRLIIKK